MPPSYLRCSFSLRGFLLFRFRKTLGDPEEGLCRQSSCNCLCEMSIATALTEQKRRGAACARPAQPALAQRQRVNPRQRRCKRTRRGSRRPDSYVAAATITLAAAPPPTQQSGSACEQGHSPCHLPILSWTHPSGHPSRVQGSYRVPGSELGTQPNPQFTGLESFSLPSPRPGWVRLVGGISPPKGPENPSPESGQAAQTKTARLGRSGSARLRGRAGSPSLALRWLRRPLRRSPPLSS